MKRYIKVMIYLFFCGSVYMFGMNLPPTIRKRYPVKHLNLRKKYPYIELKDINSGVSVRDFMIEPEHIYLVPTDKDTLKMFDLCPLFVEQKVSLEPDLLTELDEETIKQLYASQKASVSPKYHVFKNSKFETVNVAVDVPCIIPLGIFGNWNRTLLQLKSLDQFELAQKTELSPALCAGHALNNGRLMRNYALTGEMRYLKDLHDINNSADFLLDLAIEDWLNVETVKLNIAKVGEQLGVDGIDISAVSTVALFDSSLDKTLDFSLFNPEEFIYVQKVKKEIQEGLKQKNYIHVMIIGNEEAAASHGHYFCFAIIKSGNDIQYVVLDTLPGAYHLQNGSHERDRLMFVIQNIEQGSSLIKVANLRTAPEFIQSVGQHDEESLLELTLANERMEESGNFENQIKFLNAFSKKLNQFGIKKQLEKELKETLIDYRNAILKISDVFGKENVYPALRQLIEKQLDSMK
jgi:hypothetical protein